MSATCLRHLAALALAAALISVPCACDTAHAASAWPAESWTAAVDLTSLAPSDWAKNLSGAYWNPATRRLWVCTNNPARFWSLAENGSGGFAITRTYTGTGDLEGITQSDIAPDRVFLIDEEARVLRSYRVSDGAALTTWSLTAIPDWGNSGPEGIAFVPDAWLAANGFVSGSGVAYPASVQGANGFGGLLFVAVQTSGWVYAFDLRDDGTYLTVGRYLTSRTESCDLAFDGSTGVMYVLHNIGTNFLETTRLQSTVSGSDRRFTSVGEFNVPSTSNIEGFGLTPARAGGVLGDGWCFFTDDDDANGALRWFRQLHASITRRAGDGQSAGTGSAVAVPPSIFARDAFTNPIPSLTTTFSVTAGGGTIAGGPFVTDSAGVAAVLSWTLGPSPGANTLAAGVSGATNSPLVFTATGLDRTPPTAALAPVTPDPRTEPVDTLSVTFSEPVLHLDAGDFTLVRDGGANLIAPGTPCVSHDRITWHLPVSGWTSASGHYVFSLLVSDVTDDAGNALTAADSIAWDVVSLLGVPAAPAPSRLALGPVAPNPGRGPLRVPFALPRAARARLEVLDVGGRIVRTLVDEELGAGPHDAAWDGRDARGRDAGAGLYFYRLLVTGEPRPVTRRSVLVR